MNVQLGCAWNLEEKHYVRPVLVLKNINQGRLGLPIYISSKQGRKVLLPHPPQIRILCRTFSCYPDNSSNNRVEVLYLWIYH